MSSDNDLHCDGRSGAKLRIRLIRLRHMTSSSHVENKKTFLCVFAKLFCFIMRPRMLQSHKQAHILYKLQKAAMVYSDKNKTAASGNNMVIQPHTVYSVLKCIHT